MGGRGLSAGLNHTIYRLHLGDVVAIPTSRVSSVLSALRRTYTDLRTLTRYYTHQALNDPMARWTLRRIGGSVHLVSFSPSHEDPPGDPYVPPPETP